MFRWYQNAAICYVYLSEVHFRRKQSATADNSWDREFRQSRYFSKGWTLQELLAPTVVKFYSQEGEYLGDKASLLQQIHDATEIPPTALEGTLPLVRFTIEERVAWADHRDTKKPEDKAYCLQGIVGVCLAPLYGEGQDSAFRRLKQQVGDRYGKLHVTSKQSVLTRLHDVGLLPNRYDLWYEAVGYF